MNNIERGRYKLEWLKPGHSFIIYSEVVDRQPVIISHSNSYHAIDVIQKFNPFNKISINPIELSKIIGTSSRILLKDWRGKNEFTPVKLQNWAIFQNSKCLAKRIKLMWLEILKNMDQEKLAIDRRLFSMWGRSPLESSSNYCYEIILKNKYLKHDFFNYRPPAILIGNKNEFIEEEDCINWRDFLSCTGKSYKSLNKTLDNLPGGISDILIDIKNIKIQEPIFDRVKLICLLSCSRYVLSHNNINSIISMIKKSDRNCILRGFVKYKTFTRNPKLSHRRTGDLYNYISYLLDAPIRENNCKKISSYTDYAIDWHRTNGWIDQVKGIDENLKSALPNIELPKNKNIRFLSTIKDIVEEGNLMQHCISSYWKNAVRGDCFLFHVDYMNEQASVEVSPLGKVVQSRGPYNCSNKATEYGQRVLNNWAKKLVDGEFKSIEDIPF